MKKLSISEIICYGISGAIAITGLVFLIIALAGSFMGSAANDLEVFFIPGYICFPVGGVLMSIFLMVFAKNSDKAVVFVMIKQSFTSLVSVGRKRQISD